MLLFYRIFESVIQSLFHSQRIKKAKELNHINTENIHHLSAMHKRLENISIFNFISHTQTHLYIYTNMYIHLLKYISFIKYNFFVSCNIVTATFKC